LQAKAFSHLGPFRPPPCAHTGCAQPTEARRTHLMEPGSKLPGYEAVTPNGVLTVAANHSSLTATH
ncbi:MAG: hypothetical protein LBN24_01120, partial [Mediterranea sp.]|nr:hypothetical protein [Mediterranea sp.]